MRRFDHDAAERLYLGGMGSTEIAHRLGVTPSAVLYALARRGIAIRPRGATNSLLARGAKGRSSHGYVRVNLGANQRQYEHIVIAERALGRRLKAHERVHHINGDRADNRNSNLLICSHAYHLALHARMRTHPEWR